MFDFRNLFVPCLALVTLACGELKCPQGYMKYGGQCRRCPPGEERERGQCVATLDGSVEAVDGEPEDTDDADITPARDANPEPRDRDDANDVHDPGETNTPSSGTGIDAGAPCYRDEDGDGAGAGEPIDCADDRASHLSSNDIDCDDSDPTRSPNLSDVCGDRIDNDCDGTPDDDDDNACGGPCNVQLDHQPGDSCDNGLRGMCSRTGTYECTGPRTTACSASVIAASSERCGDGIDNDCDGAWDEADAVDATTWYQDCDGDGYSGLSDVLIASGFGIKRACVKPTAESGCGWTERRPIAGSTWDCDDTSVDYQPGADFDVPPKGRTSNDLDCNGAVEKEDAVMAPHEFAVVLSPFKRCAAALSCQDCIAMNPAGGAQWLAGGQPTDTQPRCSMSWSDGFPYRKPEQGWDLCPTENWGRNGTDGIQRCR